MAFFTLFCIILSIFLMSIPYCASAAEYAAQQYVKSDHILVYTMTYNRHCEEGEAVLFLHSLCGNAMQGSFLYEELQNFMFIAMDLPNHGLSGKLDPPTWDALVRSVCTVLDTYGVKKAHIVGHSFGADLALKVAEQKPGCVGSIVLIDRGYYNYSDLLMAQFTPEFYKAMEYDGESGISRFDFEAFVNLAFANDVTTTWHTGCPVLLIAADPAKNVSETDVPRIMTEMKCHPARYGLTEDLAAALPDLTQRNMEQYISILTAARDSFNRSCLNSKVIATSYGHGMLHDPESAAAVSKMIQQFLIKRGY